MSDHLRNYWIEELQDIQHAIVSKRDISLTFHFQERLEKRGIELIDVVHAIMTGSIVEGYDVGQYPGYRNPDVLRTIIGKDLKGNEVTIGIALKRDSYCLTTLYSGVTNRLLYIFE